MPRNTLALDQGRWAWVAWSAPVATLAVAAVLGLHAAGWKAYGLYVLVLSLVAYGVHALDQRRAVRGGRRVRESNLLGFSLAGGAPGAFLAMRRLRHKTRTLRFRLLVPLLAVVHLGLLGWLVVRALAPA
ncbi:MAG: DUF1294 domain-containing protein [Planctomycetota bacterium]|nr:DUF1294 domain-containing protein [Planctomycetota bacterium]